jgi:hypothetical protein
VAKCDGVTEEKNGILAIVSHSMTRVYKRFPKVKASQDFVSLLFSRSYENFLRPGWGPVNSGNMPPVLIVSNGISSG